MRYAQLVTGPAGSGKSTYCSTIVQHAETEKRVVSVVNLDPAAEYFDYTPTADIRNLIHIDDVMEDESLNFGPNGGLVFCMEYLMENTEWLQELLGDADDDYILFDCPGQIELYTHMSCIKKFVDFLKNWNFNVCSVFLVDAQFMVDGAKFLSGTVAALSVMVNLELPHVNILSKMDLLNKSARRHLESFLAPDPRFLLDSVHGGTEWGVKYRSLTEKLGQLIEDYSLVRFIPLNIKDEESIATVFYVINNKIQYGEDEEVKDRDFDAPEDPNVSYGNLGDSWLEGEDRDDSYG